VLLGAACDSVSPVAAELAGMLGFDCVWADLEHGPADWRDAQTFCQGAKAGGATADLRIPSAERHHVLHALDIGATIVVVPMVESVETARQVVQHASTRRSASAASPAVRAGSATAAATTSSSSSAEPIPDPPLRPDRNRHGAGTLRRDRAVEGLTGALVGPADLSFSLGKPLDFNKDFVAHFARAVRTIRAAGRIAATATAHPDLVSAGIEAGLQIIVCASEVVSLRADWTRTLKAMRAQIESNRTRAECSPRTKSSVTPCDRLSSTRRSRATISRRAWRDRIDALPDSYDALYTAARDLADLPLARRLALRRTERAGGDLVRGRSAPRARPDRGDRSFFDCGPRGNRVQIRRLRLHPGKTAGGPPDARGDPDCGRSGGGVAGCAITSPNRSCENWDAGTQAGPTASAGTSRTPLPTTTSTTRSAAFSCSSATAAISPPTTFVTCGT
jgi:2-keto-3-deoxy-L-rhamnonate aldolase RhmA